MKKVTLSLDLQVTDESKIKVTLEHKLKSN